MAIEDLAWIVLDTPQVSLTGALLSALAENGVVMIVPDGKHHPAGLLLPFHRHHAQAYVAHMQIDVSLPLKKRLWQVLVVAKIQNQANLLQFFGHPAGTILKTMVTHVTSGDPDNIEAQAARLYWCSLFNAFVRSNDGDTRNMLLNYGYSVVRAALARACVAFGLLPAVGLHHASRSNAFNLVDDLIEPFRPWVDRLAHDCALDTNTRALNVEDRRQMAGVLNATAVIGRERMTLLAATEAVARSVVDALEHRSAAVLVTPVLVGPV